MTRETTQFERDHAARVNVAGLLLLLVHVPVVCAVAAYLGKGVLPPAVLGMLLLSGPGFIILHRRDSPHGAIAIAIATMSFSALLIHITGGLIEAHFHIFTALALMVVFGRIAPLIAAGVTIALHHVLFWLWIPASVFNYEASLGMVALHAFFVVFELAPTCWIASQFGKNLWASGIVDERLQGAAERVSAASMQLGHASEGLAQSAAKQAATLVETSASSTQVRTIAHDNARLSTDALILMEAVSQQMSEANADLDGVQGTVTEMVDSSHQIAKVIRLIDEIAFQTNILSLNASIEAARAGQFGQGFSVVANEVRSLASRSAAAVTDTALLIEGALEKARAGQRSVHELVAAMSRVTVTTGLAKGHMEKIQNASKLQTDATQLINTSIGKLERISHQTASSAGATATSGAELREQSATLRDIVAILQHA